MPCKTLSQRPSKLLSGVVDTSLITKKKHRSKVLGSRMTWKDKTLSTITLKSKNSLSRSSTLKSSDFLEEDPDQKSNSLGWSSDHETSELDVIPWTEGPCPFDNPLENSSCTDGTTPSFNIQTQIEDDVRGRWIIVSQLGEGAYGNVKLIEDVHQKRLLAMKVITHEKDESGVLRKEAPNAVRREIAVHKRLRHENIIEFIGSRVFEKETYIFLEYACGGELYDRIEPDYGVDRKKCQPWFRQLIEGLDYLHREGICHRDIKPENLLLDRADRLKISDFGMATVFRMNGMRRTINQKCGTAAYVAPEVYTKPEFHAEPLDIWSAGIVLITMISGELPWEEAHVRHDAFCAWITGSITESPFNKLPMECLGLLRMMLDANAETRATITRIETNSWYQRGFNEKAQHAPPPVRVKFGADVPCSVPVIPVGNPGYTQALTQHMNAVSPGGLYSQPVRTSDIVMGTQALDADASRDDPLARLVKRLTRFFLTCSVKEAIETLSEILTSMHMTICRISPGSYLVTGQDRFKGKLSIKISFVKFQNKLLMDFRLSKGDGIEFKRIFSILQQKLNHLIDGDDANGLFNP